MQQRTNASRTMAAPVAAVLDVVADVEGYPRWATQFRSARVLARAADGRPRRVAFVMNAGLLKDTFTVEYVFVEGPREARISWHLVSAQVLKDLDGEYRITATPQGALVRYELEVDPGIPVLGLLRRKAETTVIHTALDDLAHVVEGIDPTP